LEYEAVLLRHASELGLLPGEAIGIVDYLCAIGHRQEIHFLWRPALNDPADEFILELAVAAQSDAVVTHNVRDFSGAQPFNVRVLTPAGFLRRLREEP
jgi:predicted nucleic acid-binding protein